MPSISAKDRVLHSVFLTSILVMIICSVATILSFKQADTLPKVCNWQELELNQVSAQRDGSASASTHLSFRLWRRNICEFWYFDSIFNEKFKDIKM